MKIKDFYKDIGIPELKAIVGKWFQKLIILFFLFFISLLIIGIANSSKKYLLKKWEDPFIQYVDVEKKSYFQKSGKQAFNAKNIEDYIFSEKKYMSDTSMMFLDIDTFFTGITENFTFEIDSVEKVHTGMFLAQDNDYYIDLISKQKFINEIEEYTHKVFDSNGNILKQHKINKTNNKFNDLGFGIIVTEQFFKEFGLYERNQWGNISFVNIEIGKDNWVKIPIAGVVNELRRNCQFAMSKNFLISYESNKEIFQKDYYNGISTYFLPKYLFNDSMKLAKLSKEFNFIDNPFQINKSSYIDGYLIETFSEIDNIDYQSNFNELLVIETKIDSINRDLRLYDRCESCNFPLNTELHKKIKIEKENKLVELKQIQTQIKDSLLVKTNFTRLDTDSLFKGAFEVLNISKNNIENNINFISDEEYFTFKLNSLNKIELFAKAIYEVFGIKVEEGKIEDKKNLDLFKGIILILYGSLISFTIISIIFFITNILISHLNSNKRSLGTLKAFGLSNTYIVGLYSVISFFIISITFLFAYICNLLVGQDILNIYLNIINIENILYENIELMILIPIMVIFPLIIILYKVFAYLHNVTPGDLIYERK